MLIFYILLFGIVNLLIFSRLTKKILIKPKLKTYLLFLLFVLIVIQFVNPYKKAIPNDLFFILFGFSLSLFIFHYGSRITIWFTIKNNKNKKDSLLFNWYNFIIFYVTYIMIFVFQIMTLIKNTQNQ